MPVSTPHRTTSNAKPLIQGKQPPPTLDEFPAAAQARANPLLDVETRYDLAFRQEGALGMLKALKNEDPESLDSVKAILTSRKPFSSVEYPVVAEFFQLTGTAADPFHGWEKLVVPYITDG